MKKKGRIIVLVVAIGVSIGLAYGILRVAPFPMIRDNLLKNWNFEAVRRSGKIKRWKEGPQRGWSVDSENPYQGNNSMQATVDWSWLNQEILAEPDRYYILKAFVRSDMSLTTGGQKDNTFLGLECLDAKNQVLRSDYGIVSAPSFWEQKIRQIYAPAGTRRIRIKLAKRRGEGSVWFDELKLEQVSTGIFLNLNFEILDREGKLILWTQDSKGGWSVDSENPYQGNNSMQATVDWSWLNQEILAEPDRYYILKAFVRSDMSLTTGGQKDNTFLGLECLDAKNQVLRSDYGIVSAPSFWEQKIRQIYAPAGTRRIRIKLAKRRGEGSVWFDELKLEEFLSVSINNSGFEIIDQSGRPNYWVQDPRGGWLVDTEKAYQGNNSMQATVGWSWLSQEIQVKPEREYSVRVYSRSDIIIPRGIEDWNTFLALECLNKEGEIIGSHMTQLNVASLWKPQVVSVYAPQETEKIRVQLAKREGEGSVWFDEPKIVKLAWYMKSTSMQRIAEDKPFFAFYFSVYFILLVLLLRLILKKVSPEGK